MTDKLVTVRGSVTSEELAAVLAAVAAAMPGVTVGASAAEDDPYEAWRNARLAALRKARSRR